MSDDFFNLASLEINEDVSAISLILNSCKTNDDVIKKASDLEKHIHKIKGLAPMMGKEDLGDLASEIDFVLKKIIDGQYIPFLNELNDSARLMEASLNSECDFSEIKKRIKNTLHNIK